MPDAPRWERTGPREWRVGFGECEPSPLASTWQQMNNVAQAWPGVTGAFNAVAPPAPGQFATAILGQIWPR
jgi:hypothetical protein